MKNSTFLLDGRIIILLMLLLLGSVATVNAATLNSTVNRNQINVNETLTLTVSYDKQVNSSELDLDELKADFEVLGIRPQNNSSISVINGQTSRVESTTWTITLTPKREGELTIPAFSIDNDTSQAITVSVNNSSPNNGANQALQVWVSANDDAIYPAEQLIVEIEISTQGNVSDLNGPQLIVNGATVEALGQQSFQRIESGVARQIVSLKYSLFAEQPGELVVPVMTFTGIQGGRRGFFGNTGNKVFARSEQLSITVKEKPTDSANTWFPADEVRIKSDWSGDTSKLVAGEPITRTITVTAHGQQASLIPPIRYKNSSAKYKSYKDQAQLDTQKSADGFIATRIESEAIVPSAKGQIELPELSVSWWNVEQERWEQAILPAETLTVSGAATTQNAVNPLNKLEPDPLTTTPTSDAATASKANLIWPLISAALAALCALQFWLILKLRRTPVVSNAQTETELSEKAAWRQLQRALASGNAMDIRNQLLVWAGTAFPDNERVSMQALIQLVDEPQLKTELSQLDRYLYSEDDHFDAKKLTSVIGLLRQSALGATYQDTQSSLVPLYQNPS